MTARDWVVVALCVAAVPSAGVCAAYWWAIGHVLVFGKKR